MIVVVVGRGGKTDVTRVREGESAVIVVRRKDVFVGRKGRGRGWTTTVFVSDYYRARVRGSFPKDWDRRESI